MINNFRVHDPSEYAAEGLHWEIGNEDMAKRFETLADKWGAEF